MHVINRSTSYHLAQMPSNRSSDIGSEGLLYHLLLGPILPSSEISQRNELFSDWATNHDSGPANAVAVISTRAPAGNDFTSTVVRPGGLTLKYSA